MKSKTFTIPEIAFIAGTRVALGSGIAFLLSEKINKDQRKGAGWVLLGIGVLTSIPILVDFITKPSGAEKPLAMAS